MKTKINLIVLQLLAICLTISLAVQSQGIEISSGGNITCFTNASIDIGNGNFINNGTFTTSSGNNVVFSASGSQTIGGTSSTIFNKIQLNNSNETKLTNTITVNNEINFVSGNLNLNGQLLILGSSGNIVNESNTKRIFGATGSLQTTRTFPAGSLTSGVNIGNMGILLKTNQELGTIIVTRSHNPIEHDSYSSIARYFDFTSVAKVDLSTITFDEMKMYYFENELINGMSESDLSLWQNDGSSWEGQQSYTLNTDQNFVSATNVTGLSQITISSGANPLPIKLLSFTAICENEGTKINWVTASELNSSYFIIEKSKDLNSFETISKIKANNTTNSTSNYSFKDVSDNKQAFYYRLTQFDFDGKSETYEPILSNCFEKDFQLTVSPNPFTNFVTVQTKAMEFSSLTLQLFSSDGRLVFSQQYSPADAVSNGIVLNLEQFESGFYTLVATTDNAIESFKLVK